jgi:putative flippase GtrA
MLSWAATVIKPQLVKNRHFLLYLVIGISGVALDLATFLLLYNMVGVEKYLANVISTSVGITNNFYWNSFHNFRVTNHLLRRYAKFYATGLVGLGLTALIFMIFVDRLHVSANLVKLASLAPVLVLQFAINKYWTFKRSVVNAQA